MAEQRLQKIIAQAGLASRRQAEELIAAGRVRVNGRVVLVPGTTADATRDRIEVDGRRLVAEAQTYVVLHKPRGVVSTLRDPEGRPTVADLIAGAPVRLFSVGRLDFDTSGVLLLTNDGEFADALLRPRQGVPKTYVVKVRGTVADAQLERWRNGVVLDDGTVTRPADVRVLRVEPGDKTWLEVTLREGKNRQIRRMADATGLRVMRLARTAFAGITCADLRPGRWRAITVEELRELRQQYGVPRRVRAQAALGTQRTSGRSSRGPAGPPRGVRRRPGSAPERSERTRAGRSGRSGRTPPGADPPGARGRGRGPR